MLLDVFELYKLALLLLLFTYIITVSMEFFSGCAGRSRATLNTYLIHNTYTIHTQYAPKYLSRDALITAQGILCFIIEESVT